MIVNKKIFYDYNLLDKLEAGISLYGSEVKSVRKGQVDIKDSFCKIINNEIFIINMIISQYKFSKHFSPDSKRIRKLLLHKKEILKWKKIVDLQGHTIVVSKIYFSKNNKIKLKIHLATGKKKHDKRLIEKEKELTKQVRRYKYHNGILETS